MKVAIITGGAGGIGAATARQLLERGWGVAIADLNVDAVETWSNESKDRVFAIQADVRDKSCAADTCDKVVAKWGRIDLLVNCAGVNRHSPFEKLSLEDWQFVIDVNLTGTFAFMQAAAIHMLKSGSGAIVNISSIAGARGVPDRCAYAATKAAIDSITKSAAVGWATRGVRVNAVAPGFTETPLVRRYIDSGNIDIDQLHSTTPMRRLASPDEIASAIVFLGSDAASFITGQTLYADGGFMAEYGIPSTYKE
ncbi:SDR family NAD(P)-dependent oxidoreductase [Rhizobium leguminosarum]